MGPNDPKYNCGNVVPTSCVPYSGYKDLKVLAFLFPDNEDKQELDCNANATDVISVFDDAFEVLFQAIDLTEINPEELDFDPAQVTLLELLQILVTGVSNNETEINTLSTAFEEWDIDDELVEVDLGDLAPSLSACESDNGKYPLKAVLQLFANKINELSNS